MPRFGQRLHLEDHKIALGEKGLEMGESVELYAPGILLRKNWIPIRWNSPLAAKGEGAMILLRIIGVEELEDWKIHSRIALM